MASVSKDLIAWESSFAPFGIEEKKWLLGGLALLTTAILANCFLCPSIHQALSNVFSLKMSLVSEMGAIVLPSLVVICALGFALKVYVKHQDRKEGDLFFERPFLEVWKTVQDCTNNEDQRLYVCIAAALAVATVICLIINHLSPSAAQVFQTPVAVWKPITFVWGVAAGAMAIHGAIHIHQERKIHLSGDWNENKEKISNCETIT